MHGIHILGEAGNIILGNENPVLIRKYRGRLTVAIPGSPIYWKIYNGAKPTAAHYGYCYVAYPSPIMRPDPPLIFATPTNTARGGFGLFSHVGGPGYWTGFYVLYAPKLDYVGGYAPWAGMDTGWEYHVCQFGDAPSSERWGMRVWNEQGKLTFDSSWDVVPFRSLLKGWGYSGGGKYGGGDSNNNHYWGNGVFNDRKKCDTAYELYHHYWGETDGTRGVMISGMSALRCIADVGHSQNLVFTTAPLIGFLSSDRTYIYASVVFGVLQHASTVFPAMDSFSLMTADMAHSTA